MEGIKYNKPIDNIQDDIKVIINKVDNIQNNINDLKQISQDIQRDAPIFIFNRTQLLIVFNRDAVGITWPSELKSVCRKYGVKLTPVPVTDLYKDSNINKTYIILIHKKCDLSSFHWYAYPGSTVPHVWGDDTVFDIVYLLEPVD